MNISFAPGTTPIYPKQRNKNKPARMDIGLFMRVCSIRLTMFPNSLIVSALINANKIVNEMGPPRIQPTSTATNITPVMAR